MKPPTSFQWLIGNPVSSLALSVGVIYVLWQSATGHMGWPLGFAAIAIGAYAAKASEAVNKYTAWRREWEGLNGSRRVLLLPRIPGLKYVFGIGAWLFLATLAIDARDDQGLTVPVALFWAGSLAAIVGSVWVWVRRGRISKGRTDDVTVCVGRPLISSSIAFGVSALPVEAAALLAASRARRS